MALTRSEQSTAGRSCRFQAIDPVKISSEQHPDATENLSGVSCLIKGLLLLTMTDADSR